MIEHIQKHFQALASIEDQVREPWTLHALSDAGFVSTPKGIYKPKGSPFALTVRRTIGSDYDDPPPLVAQNRFSAAYREEREQQGKQVYTVKALFANRDHAVPVAYLNEVAVDSGARVYELIGLGIVIDYQEGWFYFEGRTPGGQSDAR